MGDIRDRGIRKVRVFDKPNGTSSGDVTINLHSNVTFYYGSNGSSSSYTSNGSNQYNTITTPINDFAIRIRDRDLFKIDMIDFSADLKVSKFYAENFTELKYLGITDASNLIALDTTPLKRLKVLWVEKINNLPIDLTDNKELISVSFVQTNQIPQLTIDKIYADLVANGQLNGELNLTRTGTPAGDANRAILISRGWTIDNNYV